MGPEATSHPPRGDARAPRANNRVGLGAIIGWSFVLMFAGCEPPAITPNGVVGTFGGVGLAPGQFAYPRAIAADRLVAGPTNAEAGGTTGETGLARAKGGRTASNGSVFVVDKDARVQRFAADGTLETYWRMPECAKGKPVGLTVHPDGRVFVADTHYSRVLIFDREGNLLDSFGSAGSGDGQFQLPTDVAIDAGGFIYVSEYNGNDRITKWSPELQFVQVIGDGLIAGQPLRRPTGLEIDKRQTLWVADACNHRIIRFSLTGELLFTFGSFGEDPGELRYPYDISESPDGTLLVCEYGGNRLQWFSTEGRSLRVWGKSGRAPGELFSPWGATWGPDGKIFVVDSLNNRVQIIKP